MLLMNNCAYCQRSQLCDVPVIHTIVKPEGLKRLTSVTSKAAAIKYCKGILMLCIVSVIPFSSYTQERVNQIQIHLLY